MSACVKSNVFFLVEKVTFQIRTCLRHLIDSIVFFGTAFNYLQNQSGYVILCTIIDEVMVMQSLELIYIQKFQKAGMSILGDAKSYYVKNSSVNSVIIYIHMNILKMNFWIFFH